MKSGGREYKCPKRNSPFERLNCVLAKLRSLWYVTGHGFSSERQFFSETTKFVMLCNLYTVILHSYFIVRHDSAIGGIFCVHVTFLRSSWGVLSRRGNLSSRDIPPISWLRSLRQQNSTPYRTFPPPGFSGTSHITLSKFATLQWHSFCDQHVLPSDGFYDFVEDEGDRRAANVRERKRMCSINVAFIVSLIPLK